MSSDEMSNKTKIWGFAAGAGVVAFLLLKFTASYSFWPALLLAVLIGVLVAILLWIGFYHEPEIEGEDAQTQRANLSSGTMTTGTTGIAAPPTVTEPPAAKPAEPKKPAEPAKPAAAEKPAGAGKPKAAPKPKAKAAKADKKSAAKASSSMMGEAGNKMVAEKKAEKAAIPAAAGDKPELLKVAREGGPDDLKQIKGVGPKLEAELHRIGVYHFDQIAGLSKKEVAWMDENLAGVRQRVSRDDWVAQAKVLAEGGQTEFSKRVKKGDVY